MASSNGAYRNGASKGTSARPSSVTVKSSAGNPRIPSQARRSLRHSSIGSYHAATSADGVPGRVRVAVRLRPRNAEELASDADYADCVELQPEFKRLRLRKNNWDADTYEFDEVLIESASQKRVYEAVARPVVESVLEGYNGTVMAYGQTGTGKTYTLGCLGEDDVSKRGIMVRAMEDILADTSPGTDVVSVSYLQLYMETVQDLLNPENSNIHIVEDSRSGDVSLPGATLVDVRDQHSFMELLRLGESHRFAANTKLNTESSRSHAILMIYVTRSVADTDATLTENKSTSHFAKPLKPFVRKSKLVLVDLAGSERIHKSGSEGNMLEEAKFINLSLSALGKCINAIAENSAHVPIRDSKLTRLLKDSFGGTARTSLVVTIGPSSQHRGETSSTILFGQRAMKIENMLKIKEEFDYKSLSRKLEIQVDNIIAENERQQKMLNEEIERVNLEAENRISEVERNFAEALEKERLKCQMEYMESIKKLEEKLLLNQKHHQNNGLLRSNVNNEENSEDLFEIKKQLQNEIHLRDLAEDEVTKVQTQLEQFMKSAEGGDAEIVRLRQLLDDENSKKKQLKQEIAILQSRLLQQSYYSDQTRNGSNIGGSDFLSSPFRPAQFNPSGGSLFEQVGLEKILSLLESDDSNTRVHAVKVVANLAAEESNQVKIVEYGGLTSLLVLLRNYDDETIRRVTAGAIANLAMNESNQELIMAQGGISLLSMTAIDSEDPQTLRMIAGALANLCGNDKLQSRIRSEGGIRALLGMVRCVHRDVLSQVARAVANFAKCESRASSQGLKSGKSVLIEDGVLPWIVQNSTNESAPIRRHTELALCHMAQNEKNAKEMINGGALWELIRISRDCSREDIRNLARRSVNSSPIFRAELRKLRVEI